MVRVQVRCDMDLLFAIFDPYVFVAGSFDPYGLWTDKNVTTSDPYFDPYGS